MKHTLTPRTRDILWHGGKALLCALQYGMLDRFSRSGVSTLLDTLYTETIISKAALPWASLLYPVVSFFLFVALWRYADILDDRSFNLFCAAPEPPHLTEDPGFCTELILTTLSAGFILFTSLYPRLVNLGLGPYLGVLMGLFLAFPLVLWVSVRRVRNLEETWLIQKDLRTSNTRTRVGRSILYAAVYFLGLALLVTLGIGSLLLIWGSLILSFGAMIFRPAGFLLATLLVLSCLIALIRNLRGRVKFMKRLAGLRDRGELSFTVHGHPYLSVLIPKLFFGLTITDAPHPDSKRKADQTYVVTVLTTLRRKGTIVLCSGNVYRFMYALRMRGIGSFGAGGPAILSARLVSVPAGAWYTNHGFRFPEGEGKRILLLDPTPRVLAIHGRKADELVPLDNASEVFGYTVYGKNSFVNLLERT